MPRWKLFLRWVFDQFISPIWQAFQPKDTDEKTNVDSSK